MVEYKLTINNTTIHYFLRSKQPISSKTNTTKELFSLIDFCELCSKVRKTMSSIPQGMFAAKKIRENQDKMTIARVNHGENASYSKKHFNTKLMELTPLKYNSKLMNSIWGLYNRYSPHNIKSTVDETSNVGDLQQPFVVNLPKTPTAKEVADGTNKITGKIQNQNNISKLDNFWKTIPISQSH